MLLHVLLVVSSLGAAATVGAGLVGGLHCSLVVCGNQLHGCATALALLLATTALHVLRIVTSILLHVLLVVSSLAAAALAASLGTAALHVLAIVTGILLHVLL